RLGGADRIDHRGLIAAAGGEDRSRGVERLVGQLDTLLGHVHVVGHRTERLGGVLTAELLESGAPVGQACADLDHLPVSAVMCSGAWTTRSRRAENSSARVSSCARAAPILAISVVSVSRRLCTPGAPLSSSRRVRKACATAVCAADSAVRNEASESGSNSASAAVSS